MSTRRCISIAGADALRKQNSFGIPLSALEEALYKRYGIRAMYIFGSLQSGQADLLPVVAGSGIVGFLRNQGDAQTQYTRS